MERIPTCLWSPMTMKCQMKCAWLTMKATFSELELAKGQKMGSSNLLYQKHSRQSSNNHLLTVGDHFYDRHVIIKSFFYGSDVKLSNENFYWSCFRAWLEFLVDWSLKNINRTMHQRLLALPHALLFCPNRSQGSFMKSVPDLPTPNKLRLPVVVKNISLMEEA